MKRCKCVISEEACSGLCNCHGNCGGKVCGGVPKSTKGRQGRKRYPHILQKINTPGGSKSYLVSKKLLNPKSLKSGKAKHARVCGCLCNCSETTSTGNDKASNMDVKKCYDEILKLIKMHDIPLPLNSRSLKELESGLKKICAIRKNMCH